MFQIHTLKPIIRIPALVTAFEAKYDKSFHFPGETHNFWEMVYVEEGRVGVTANERVHELAVGEIIFHQPMEYHRIWSAGETEPKVIIVSFFADGEQIASLQDGVFRLKGESRRLIELLGEQLRLYRNEKSDPLFPQKYQEDSFAFQNFTNLLELFLLSVIGNKKEANLPVNNEAATIYKEVVGFMNDNLCKDLSVEDIAFSCHVSPSNLKKIFLRYSACGVHKYFLNLKILRAASLLKNGNSVKQVSESLGFNNQNYFSAVFKRETGYSPRAFVKQESR